MRRSLTCPFDRTSTACSASFGPIARAASSPVAPSGSSSSELSGRTTFMRDETEDKDMHLRRRLDGAGQEGSAGSAGASRDQREDDRNDEVEESPVPDPEADG